MKRRNWSELISVILLPAVLAVAGLVLLVNPNAATALISKVLGWGLIAGGVVSAIVTITGWPVKGVPRVIVTVVLLIAGSYLSRNPLALAANMGKLLGFFLVIQGAVKLLDSYGAKTLPAISLIAGVILLLFPLTLSQILFRIVGGVLLVIGISNLLAGLQDLKDWEEPDDPNIIDAAP